MKEAALLQVPTGANIALTQAINMANTYGWYIFPIDNGSKIPLVRRWNESDTAILADPKSDAWDMQYSGATRTSQKRINRWNMQNKCANYACSLGPSGLQVLDLDMAKEMPNGVLKPDGDDTMRGLMEGAGISDYPNTFTVRTPSGGTHRYYTNPKQLPCTTITDKSVDIKAFGGQVLLPGSSSSKGVYTVINDAPISDMTAELEELINANTRRGGARTSNVQHSTSTNLTTRCNDADSAVRTGRATQYLRGLEEPGEGGRNFALFNAACRLRWYGVTPDVAMGLFEQECPWVGDLGADEVYKTIGSAYSVDSDFGAAMGAFPELPPGVGSAERKGVAVPVTSTPFDAPPEVVQEGLVVHTLSLPPTGVLSATEEDDFMARMLATKVPWRRYQGQPVPKIDWLVEGMIPYSLQPALFAGEPGASKSLLSAQLCREVSLGSSWLGRATPKRKSLYLTFEDSPEDLHRRYAGSEAQLNPNNVEYDGERMYVGELGLEICRPMQRQGGTLERGKHYNAFIKMLLDSGIQLLVIDHLSRVFTADENDRGTVNQLNSFFTQLCAEAQCMVILLSHTNKLGEVSGSTAMTGMFRYVAKISVSENKDGYKFEELKANNKKRDFKPTKYLLDGTYCKVINPDDVPAVVSPALESEYVDAALASTVFGVLAKGAQVGQHYSAKQLLGTFNMYCYKFNNDINEHNKTNPYAQKPLMQTVSITRLESILEVYASLRLIQIIKQGNGHKAYAFNFGTSLKTVTELYEQYLRETMSDNQLQATINSEIEATVASVPNLPTAPPAEAVVGTESWNHCQQEASLLYLLIGECKSGTHYTRTELYDIWASRACNGTTNTTGDNRLQLDAPNPKHLIDFMSRVASAGFCKEIIDRVDTGMLFEPSGPDMNNGLYCFDAFWKTLGFNELCRVMAAVRDGHEESYKGARAVANMVRVNPQFYSVYATMPPLPWGDTMSAEMGAEGGADDAAE